MDLAALRPLISATSLTDVAVCRAELVAIVVARGLLDAREVEVVRRLDELAAADTSLFPQEVVAKASFGHGGAGDCRFVRVGTGCGRRAWSAVGVGGG